MYGIFIASVYILTDNGSPITGYLIEKKDKYGNWEKAAEIPGDVTTGRAEGLTEGQQYEFRVSAINKGGIGEPSDPTQPHIARHKNMAPKIDQSALKNIKILAGHNFEFDVPVSGEPPPTKEWSLKGLAVLPDDHIKLNNEDYSTKLRVVNAQRADSGVYTLTAKNRNGTDSATVTVTVLDIPSPPQAPLTPSNVTKSSCQLAWKPPADDGG